MLKVTPKVHNWTPLFGLHVNFHYQWMSNLQLKYLLISWQEAPLLGDFSIYKWLQYYMGGRISEQFVHRFYEKPTLNDNIHATGIYTFQLFRPHFRVILCDFNYEWWMNYESITYSMDGGLPRPWKFKKWSRATSAPYLLDHTGSFMAPIGASHFLDSLCYLYDTKVLSQNLTQFDGEAQVALVLK